MVSRDLLIVPLDVLPEPADLFEFSSSRCGSARGLPTVRLPPRGQAARLASFANPLARLLAIRSSPEGRAKDGGPDRDRTGDLMNAIHARSQLRHWPTLDQIYRNTSAPLVGQV